jgi:hypothetical protein
MAYVHDVPGFEEIAALREKYAEILAMRRQASSPETDLGGLAATRARMAALAARFPGALRELDDLELPEIQRRIESLDAVLGGAGEVELWMNATALFHSLARGALWAKRWLRGKALGAGELEVAYEADAKALEFARDALVWKTELALIARPPGGRLTWLIYARIGRALGLPEAQVPRTVFGARKVVMGPEAAPKLG